MDINRDPQNSIAETIDNALRGALIKSGVHLTETPGGNWSPKEEAFLYSAVRSVMAALGISDTIPSGVWVVFQGDIVNSLIHSVHLSELEALRVPQVNGYFMRVQFMEFGKELS